MCASDVFENERNAPVIPNWFQPCQCYSRLGYPGEYLRLGTVVSYKSAYVLDACESLKLLSVYFGLHVDAAGVLCHQFGLVGSDLHAVGWGGFVKTCHDSLRLQSHP